MGAPGTARCVFFSALGDYNRRISQQTAAGVSYSLYNSAGQLMMRQNPAALRTFALYLGNNLIAERDIGSSNTIRYQHTDVLGSVIAESNTAGTITSSSVYQPFGERIGGQKTGIGFTGHLEDKDIGLTYMQQRYYDPVVGRFYSNDPVGFKAGNPITFNRYAYGNNNPYKFVDPDGRESIGIMAMERDIIALADGSLSKEDYKTNQQARAVGAMVGAAFALTNLSATSSIGRLASFNSKRSGHIFRQADDHVSPSTQSSRDRMADLFEDVTSFSNLDNSVLTNFQRGKGGFLGFSKQFQNGKVWGQTKGGEIQNAGVVKQMTSKSNSFASKSIKVVRVSGRLDAKNSR